MLIVCTQDQIIRMTAENPNSGSPAWSPVKLLGVGGQPAATVQFETALKALQIGEPLAISAHGNDREVGDEERRGWGWSVLEIALMLDRCAPEGWLGPVLIHACARTVANFSAGLAVELTRSRFSKMWCYGYNKALDSRASFPDPATLAVRPDLHGTQVS